MCLDKGVTKMASKTSSKKNKVGITLNDATLEILNKESQKLGLSKSAYISMIINQEGGKSDNFA